MILSRWADEYQVEAMRKLCEEFIMSKDCNPAHSSINAKNNGQEALIHALQYNMPRRLEQCINSMVDNLDNGGIHGLAPLAAPGHEPLMQMVWPRVCKKVNPNVLADGGAVNDIPMPPLEHIRSLWPFIATTVTNTTGRIFPRHASTRFTRPSNWP